MKVLGGVAAVGKVKSVAVAHQRTVLGSTFGIYDNSFCGERSNNTPGTGTISALLRSAPISALCEAVSMRFQNQHGGNTL